MMTSPSKRRGVSVQIVAKRVTVVRSNRTRSGVAALGDAAIEPESRRSGSSKPRSMMITLITTAAAAWSLLALLGHY
jgi:hypothetical protein